MAHADAADAPTDPSPAPTPAPAPIASRASFDGHAHDPRAGTCASKVFNVSDAACARSWIASSGRGATRCWDGIDPRPARAERVFLRLARPACSRGANRPDPLIEPRSANARARVRRSRSGLGAARRAAHAARSPVLARQPPAERLDQRREAVAVDADRAIALEQLERHVLGQRRPVRTVRGQRLEAVGHREDARRERISAPCSRGSSRGRRDARGAPTPRTRASKPGVRSRTRCV